MHSEQFELHAQIELEHWWFVARRRIVRSLVERLVSAASDSVIVDVGCGTGGNLADLAGDYRCVGIDTCEQAVELARKRFPAAQWLHGFAPGALTDVLPQTRLVLLMDVLEHVADDYRLLSELLAAMPVGSHLLVTVPAELALWSKHDESFGHYRRYDLDQLEKLWQGLPVTPLMASYYNTRLYPAIKAARWWGRRRGASFGAANTDFRIPAKPVNRGLTSLFEGESKRLLQFLGTSRPAYSRGVSLIAVLRREVGEIIPRSKPDDAMPDYFDPATGEFQLAETT
jgi:SAM-dependent methyltransferase